MSYIPEVHLEGQNLIVHYIVECRGKGHFLPYDENRLIGRWLEACGNDANSLLLILAEHLPSFYEKAASRSQPPSLLRLDKKISKILEARQLRTHL